MMGEASARHDDHARRASWRARTRDRWRVAVERLGAEGRATGLPLRAILVSSLALHVWVTLLAGNPLHADEHFQVLEFAWARGGHAPVHALPWEWPARIRQSLLPTLALAGLEGLRALGVTSPQVWVLTLRFGAMLAAFAVSLAVMLHVAPTLPRPGRRALWLAGPGLWISPLLFARFTSENLAGLAFALALVMVERSARGVGSRRHELAAGVLLGCAFLFRFQMALAIVPVVLWVLRREGMEQSRRPSLRVGRLMGGLLGAIVAGALLDAWFYGAPTATAWNYVRANLLEQRAASFGTSPWHAYLAWASVALIPPLGPVLLVATVVGMVRHPRSPWSWAAASFLAGHLLVGHKELRFLLPLLYAWPVLVARGAAAMAGSRPWRAALVAGVATNLAGILLVASPALHRGRELDADYTRYLWRLAERYPSDTIYVRTRGGSAYAAYGLEPAVFRHPRIRSVPIDARDAVPPGTPAERDLLLTRGGVVPPGFADRIAGAAYRAEPGYRSIARRLGIAESWPVRWLDAHDGWRDSPEARQLWRLRPDPRAR